MSNHRRNNDEAPSSCIWRLVASIIPMLTLGVFFTSLSIAHGIENTIYGREESQSGMASRVEEELGFLEEMETLRLLGERVTSAHPDLDTARYIRLINSKYGEVEDSLRQSIRAKSKKSGIDADMLFLLVSERAKENCENRDFRNYNVAKKTFDQLRLYAGKGYLRSPIMELFLSIKYGETPGKEVADGYVSSFFASGTDMDKLMNQGDFTMSIPYSWKGKKGNNPGVAYKYISKNGNGSEECVISITDLVQVSHLAGEDLSRSEIAAFQSKEKIRTVAKKYLDVASAKMYMAQIQTPSGNAFQLLQHSFVSFSGWPGCVFDVEDFDNLGSNSYLFVRYYCIQYKTTSISVAFYVFRNRSESHAEFRERIKKQMKLFDAIFETMELQEK